MRDRDRQKTDLCTRGQLHQQCRFALQHKGNCMVQRAHRKSPQYQGVGSWCPKHVPMNARVRHAAVQLQQQRNASSQRESAPHHSIILSARLLLQGIGLSRRGLTVLGLTRQEQSFDKKMLCPPELARIRQPAHRCSSPLLVHGNWPP